MVSLLFKEQEYKLEKLKFKKLEVYAADQKQIWAPRVWAITT